MIKQHFAFKSPVRGLEKNASRVNLLVGLVNLYTQAAAEWLLEGKMRLSFPDNGRLKRKPGETVNNAIDCALLGSDF